MAEGVVAQSRSMCFVTVVGKNVGDHEQIIQWKDQEADSRDHSSGAAVECVSFASIGRVVFRRENDLPRRLYERRRPSQVTYL